MPTDLDMKKWELPPYYFGATWDDYYVFLGQHRDSDTISRSNFQCGLAALGGESETVFVVHEGHWAVGWVEWIAIHESDTESIAKANEILRELDGYPVVDDDHLSELEWNEVQEYWERMSIKERISYLKDENLSIFAARRDCYPSDLDEYGSLFERLRG